MFNDRSEPFIPNLVPKDSKVSKRLCSCEKFNLSVVVAARTYRYNSCVITMKPNFVSWVGVVELAL